MTQPTRPRLASIVRPSVLLLLASSLTACGESRPPEPPLWNAEATQDSARQFVDAIPKALRADGPAAWSRLFEDTPAAFMASDGAMAFPAHDSLDLFLNRFSPTVSSLELIWDAVRIDPLAPSLASLAIPYRERIVMTSDSVSAFGGFVTGVARHRAGEWRLQHLHWSSPAASTE